MFDLSLTWWRKQGRLSAARSRGNAEGLREVWSSVLDNNSDDNNQRFGHKGRVLRCCDQGVEKSDWGGGYIHG